MKKLSEMNQDELVEEFDCYAAENGMDRELDYDQETAFENWLHENDIELGEDD